MSDNQSLLGAEMARLTELFVEAGGLPLAINALQPADALLDLYGEDIRGRAFVTSDGLSELMLRPDFTAPVVAHHMAEGAEPARYTYSGPVWRKLSAGGNRAREFEQVGFELFDRSDAAEADAEVFALISKAVEGYGLSVASGDMGIIIAALDAIDISEARRAALSRHLWRPKRFRALLTEFAKPGVLTERRAALLQAYESGKLDAAIQAQAAQGVRGLDEVKARVAELAAEVKTPLMAAEQVALLDAIFALSGTARDVLERLELIAQSLPKMKGAVATLARRLDALDQRGIDTQNLGFEVSYGRTTLEYYDGFVFGFFAPDRPELPVVASGGRYDALTRQLGQGQSIPAVGGVVRPQALLAVQGAAA